MTTVVTDKCNGCRFTDCVNVCPVECFHYDEQMLYIDPGVCIDCGACLPECPVHAIYQRHGKPREKFTRIEEMLNLVIASRRGVSPGRVGETPEFVSS